VGSWTPQKPQTGAFADVPAGDEPLGFVLVNDDLASEWTVRRGDVLAAVTIDMSKKASAAAPNEQVFPSLVNCLAAWNYCAFPAHWLQRAHTDPASGDLVPGGLHPAQLEPRGAHRVPHAPAIRELGHGVKKQMGRMAPKKIFF
jgi:hypothetical protein